MSSEGIVTKPEISLCLTFKNRASYLKVWFQKILEQTYEMKKVQVCIADGGSTDEWKDIVKAYHPKFHSVKTAFCDREELPFKVASNCPATDRNAMVCNMPDAEKIVVVDPEVLMTNPYQLRDIVHRLSEKELMLYHTCYRLPKGTKPVFKKDMTIVGKPVKFGGYMQCYNKTAFMRNGGYDERYSLGFAGEDSYFIWWWMNNRIAKVGKYPVMHIWHPSPSSNPAYAKLRKEYTLPLHNRLKKANAYPNGVLGDKWKRPETLKEVQLWKA